MHYYILYIRLIQPVLEFVQYIGGSKGAPGTRPPMGSNSFIFIQFSGSFWPNGRLAPPPWVLASPSLGNPGSATAVCQRMAMMFTHFWTGNGPQARKSINIRASLSAGGSTIILGAGGHFVKLLTWGIPTLQGHSKNSLLLTACFSLNMHRFS